MFRLSAYTIISAVIALGGCLSLLLSHKEQVRRYTRITKFLFWVAFAIAIVAILWGALTIVTEVGYRVLGVCVFVLAATLYSAVFWLGLHYSTDTSRPRTKGRKAIAVLLFLFFPATFFYLLTGITAGTEALPRWSDLLFILTILGPCTYMHEFFAHMEGKLSSGSWKGLTVTSVIFLVAFVWVIIDSLAETPGTIRR